MFSANGVSTKKVTTVTGQAAFTSPGSTTSWTCPANVYSVCAVCIGGSSDSYFINTSTVAGRAGVWGGTGYHGSGGGYTGDGGGGGGSSGVASANDPSGYWCGPGGGGAGGYTGNGGNGGNGDGDGVTQAHYTGANGGGVGIYGAGANGAYGNASSDGLTYGTSGSGGGGGGACGGSAATGRQGGAGGAGSGGTGATYGGGGGGLVQAQGGGGLGWKNNIPVTPGQTYTVVVGGKATAASDPNTYAGGGGAVRLIWGPNRAFPSTNTGDM